MTKVFIFYTDEPLRHIAKTFLRGVDIFVNLRARKVILVIIKTLNGFV